MSQVLNANDPTNSPDVPAAVPLVDGPSAAWLASLLLHLLAVVLLGAASLALPRGDTLLALAIDPVVEDVEALPEEFVSSDEWESDVGALSVGGEGAAIALAPELTDEPIVADPAEVLPEIAERPVMELDLETARAPEFDEEFIAQGAGSVGVTGAEGAIDRLTHEILASLEQRPTLVVWLFDESGSLRDERAAIANRFQRIYEELGVIEAADNPAFRRHEDKPLLTAVVGFGSEPELLTPKPTDRIEEIVAAVRSIEERSAEPQRDADGNYDEEEYRRLAEENVFTAVGMAAEKFRSYQSRRNGQRRVMLVVFTDESGNDVHLVDDTVDLCRRLSMPVYVVGRPAPFGRDTAYVKWIDPDPRFDQRPKWVPISLGPESLMPEALRLRFGNGGEEELLDSGFGPYALTRLCYDTGGLYFATHPNRVVGREVTGAETDNLAAHFAAFFDPDAMRRYQPDYVPTSEYVRLVQASRSRRALVEAAQMTWTSPLEDVRLRFPKRDEAELAQLLSQAQRAAAILQPKLDMLCQTLLAGEEDREQEGEPRWQAGFDLALGRALAAKVRADGYNMMLAEAKGGMPFEQPRNNTWVLRPDDEYPATSLEKLAAEARLYLERVIADHPETPWAMLAERELVTPLGWRWDEDYSFIPPRMEGGEGRPRPPREPTVPEGPPSRDPPPL
jgi:hypothetical protein